MSGKDSKYIAAFSYSSLTPVYDSLMKYAMRESIFKNHLASQVRLDKARRVLDLGCGTATLTISTKKRLLVNQRSSGSTATQRFWRLPEKRSIWPSWT